MICLARRAQGFTTRDRSRLTARWGRTQSDGAASGCRLVLVDQSAKDISTADGAHRGLRRTKEQECPVVRAFAGAIPDGAGGGCAHLPSEDGDLMAKHNDLDVLVGVHHPAQPNELRRGERSSGTGATASRAHPGTAGIVPAQGPDRLCAPFTQQPIDRPERAASFERRIVRRLAVRAEGPLRVTGTREPWTAPSACVIHKRTRPLVLLVPAA